MYTCPYNIVYMVLDTVLDYIHGVLDYFMAWSVYWLMGDFCTLRTHVLLMLNQASTYHFPPKLQFSMCRACAVVML